MRVALVLGPGFDDPYAVALVRGLVARGARVDVYGPARERLTEAGARMFPLEMRAHAGPRDVTVVPQLRRALRAGTDVIHALGPRAGFLASRARLAGVPLVVSWHTPFGAYGRRGVLHRALAHAVVSAARVVLCGSTEQVRAATRLGARDARLSMVRAPELPPPAQSPAEVRAEFELPAEAPLVVSVGRLHPDKRYDVLVAAAARWRHLRPMPTVVIAGTGPAYRSLAAQIVVPRAPVILAGHRGDVSDLLHAADVAVAAGDGAGSPLFVQEVLSAGAPLVAAAAGDITEIVGDAAVLVPPGDVDAVDAAVRALLADPRARAERAAAGLARARTWPTEAETVDRVIAVYEELAGPAAVRDAPHDLR